MKSYLSKVYKLNSFKASEGVSFNFLDKNFQNSDQVNMLNRNLFFNNISFNNNFKFNHFHKNISHFKDQDDVEIENGRIFDFNNKSPTPIEIVKELDQYIVGQNSAKKAVAIAYRNRWRKLQLDPKLRDEVIPKNILLKGPPGSGKYVSVDIYFLYF